MVANNKNTNDTSINRNDIVWYPALKDIFCYAVMYEWMYVGMRVYVQMWTLIPMYQINK